MLFAMCRMYVLFGLKRSFKDGSECEREKEVEVAVLDGLKAKEAEWKIGMMACSDDMRLTTGLRRKRCREWWLCRRRAHEQLAVRVSESDVRSVCDNVM